LWLELAGHANAMARRLSDGLAKLDDVRISYPTHANAVFAELPKTMSERLEAAGAVFYPWICPDDPASGRMVRLICSWTTTEAEVTQFLHVAAAA
jgi:threonine aldolase